MWPVSAFPQSGTISTVAPKENEQRRPSNQQQNLSTKYTVNVNYTGLNHVVHTEEATEKMTTNGLVFLRGEDKTRKPSTKVTSTKVTTIQVK